MDVLWLSLIRLWTPDYLLTKPKTHRSWEKSAPLHCSSHSSCSAAQRGQEFCSSDTDETDIPVQTGRPYSNMCFRQIALRTIELHNYVECHQSGVNLSVARRQTLELIDLRGFKNKLLKAPRGGSAYLSLTMCLSEHPNLSIQVAELLLPILWESGSSPPISKCYFWKNQQDCVSRNNDPLHQINPHSLLTAVHWRDCCLSQYEMCIKLMEGVVLSSRKYSFTTSFMML